MTGTTGLNEPLPDTMSYEVFAENESQIVAEVSMIRSAKGKTRKRFRILAIYEQGSSSLLGEVLRTSFGPVVVYRTALGGESPPAGDGNYLLGYRQGRKYPGIAPLTGNPDQYFSMVASKGTAPAEGSKMAHYPVTGAWISARSYPDDLLVFK
jgi:hypothetical protein